MKMAGNEFDFDVLARGAFIDDLRDGGQYPESIYSIEVVTIRLNHIALNRYNDFFSYNPRECYVNGSEGDKQWEQHLVEKKKKQLAWEKDILDRLEFNNEHGNPRAVITHVHSEIFTVVCTTKLIHSFENKGEEK